VKKFIGTVLIIIGCFLDLAGLWTILVGGEPIGAIVFMIIGLILLLLGFKLTKKE